MALQVVTWPPASGASQVEVEAAVLAALKAFFPGQEIGQIYHDAAVNNVTATYTEAGGTGGGSIPAGVNQMQVSSILGSPIQLAVGANAGAAVSTFNLVPGGGPVVVPFLYTAGDKLFVKTLDGATVSSGCFVVNFMGPQ